MEFPLTLIDLGGCVALLLWGVHMVHMGVQRAFGARLGPGWVGRCARGCPPSPPASVSRPCSSSTATGLMVTSFAASGFVDFVPGLAVMLGANVGTTLIVQLLSFDVAAISPALLLIGLMMFRRGVADPRHRSRADRPRASADGVAQLLIVVTPYEDTPSLRILLGAISTEPVLDVILAAAFTWLAHSSVAIVLLVMSLATKGAIPPMPRTRWCWEPISARR